TIATMKGVKIDSLKVKGYSKVNMKSVLEIEEGPVVEEVGITLEVISPAPMEVLEEIKKLADQKCPAAYTVSHAVPFRSKIKASQP
ncbi:MAG: OsmC family protein, partial [Candidatus Caldipriscus sp.]